MHVAQKWIREYQGLQILRDFLTKNVNFVGVNVGEGCEINNARVILFVQITSSGRRDVFFDENDPGCLGFFFGDEIQLYIGITSYNKPLKDS